MSADREASLVDAVQKLGWKCRVEFSDVDGRRAVNFLFPEVAGSPAEFAGRPIHGGLILEDDWTVNDVVYDFSVNLRHFGHPNEYCQYDALDPVRMTWSKFPSFRS